MNWEAPIFARRARAEKAEWQRWFAWYPVRYGDRWYWLQTILRWQQWTMGYYTPRYRPLCDWRKR